MRITRIEPQRKRRGRRNVYADGQFVLGLSDETLLRAGLRTGDELSAERLASLKRMEERQRAKRTALRYLSTRPRTERELRDRLRDAECSDEDIGALLEELRQSGLVNDEEFARSFVRDSLARRPTGQLLLRQKMLLLGLEKSLVERVLAEILDVDVQHQSALTSARHYLGKKPTPRGLEQERKLRSLLAAHLARRGFSWDTIGRVLSATLPSHPEPEGESLE